MDWFLYTTFLLTAFGFIVIPGPNVLVIVSTSLCHGTRRGLLTVAGTSTAMALQLAIAAIASLSLIEALQHGLQVLKWLGLVYLIYLALSHWRRILRGKLAVAADAQKPEAAAWGFARGFIVSLSNPKTILFFTAFLPQFASASYDTTTQIILLSLSFWLLAIVFDSLYALTARWLMDRWLGAASRRAKPSNSARRKLSDERRAQLSADDSRPQLGPTQRRVLDAISGTLYALAAIGLYLHSRSKT